MKKHIYSTSLRMKLAFLFVSFSIIGSAQQTPLPKSKSIFWEKVQFGGGFGINVGSGFTDITLAPSAIYNVNNYIGLGFGLQGSRVAIKNEYSSWIYGANAVVLINPVEEFQVSLEVEQLRVNSVVDYIGSEYKDNFWNTAVFVGGGYRADNITVGARYNLLFDKDKTVYAEGFMPFIRAYF